MRNAEPEDYRNDAIIFLVLLELKKRGASSVITERLQQVCRLLFRLLERSGVDLTTLNIHGNESKDLLVQNALSSFAIDRLMFTKVRNDGQYHFEECFERSGRKVHKQYLAEGDERLVQHFAPHVIRAYAANTPPHQLKKLAEEIALPRPEPQPST